MIYMLHIRVINPFNQFTFAFARFYSLSLSHTHTFPAVVDAVYLSSLFSLLQTGCWGGGAVVAERSQLLEGWGSGDAAPPGHDALSGHAAGDCWRGHGPVRGPAPTLSPPVWSWAVPGPGGRGPAGQWTLHGHEESSGSSAWTLPPAPPYRHALQPTAGPGYTKVHMLRGACTKMNDERGRERTLHGFRCRMFWVYLDCVEPWFQGLGPSMGSVAFIFT